jgi:hypothetical protein
MKRPVLYVLHKGRAIHNKTDERSVSTLYRHIVRRQKRAVCHGSCAIAFLMLHTIDGKKTTFKTAHLFNNFLYSN